MLLISNSLIIHSRDIIFAHINTLITLRKSPKQMKKMPELQEIKNHISDFAKQHKNIIAVYLFGSTATEKQKEESDIDLALMTAEPVSGYLRIEWETELSLKTNKDIDLVIFNQAGVLLRHQILKYGTCIYESYPNARIKQGMIARAEYLDTRFLFKKLAV